MNRFLFSAILLFCVGCGAVKKAISPPLPPPPEVREDQLIRYVAPDFSQERLAEGGLSVIEVSFAGAPEGTRANAAFELFQGVRSVFPNASIFPRTETMDKMRAADRLPDAVRFLKDYEQRRRLDPPLLSDLGRIAGTRYLLYGKVTEIEKFTGVRFLNAGEKTPEGQASVFSSGPNLLADQVRKVVRLSVEIWDTKCGLVVFSGEGGAAVEERAGEEQVRVEDVFISAARSVAAALGRGLNRPGPAAVRKGCS